MSSLTVTTRAASKAAVVITLEKICNEAGDVYAIMNYQPEKNYLLMKWIGFSTEEEIKVASLRMLDWQRREGHKRGCKFHVHNTKEIASAWSGLVDWINNELFPPNYEAGLRYNLSILSPDLFSKLSSEALFLKHNPRVPTVLFETLSQAERWLTEKYREL
jgi:hypothetical protein